MKHPLTKILFCAAALGLTMLAASQAAAVVIEPRDKLTLSLTFHTQVVDVDTTHSVVKSKIVETTLDTADVLKILAKDLGVTSNGRLGFPQGSYLLLMDGIHVQSPAGQTWDVSAYLQYSLAADVVLVRGTTALNRAMPQGMPLTLQPPRPLSGDLTYTSLVHIHFEDANHVADCTGFATTQGASYTSVGTTSISLASGSGLLDGKPALITGHAELAPAPWSLLPLK